MCIIHIYLSLYMCIYIYICPASCSLGFPVGGVFPKFPRSSRLSTVRESYCQSTN